MLEKNINIRINDVSEKKEEEKKCIFSLFPFDGNR